MSRNEILVAGECLIDFLPVDESQSDSPEVFQRRAGGAPANVAVALSKIGNAPLFWTSVGDDSFGNYLRSVLEQASIPSQFVIRRTNKSTGIAIVDDSVKGGFELYLSKTATTDFRIDDIPESIFAELEWLHLGGVLLSREPARSAMFELVDRAKESDCIVSFDPNTRPSIWPSAGECIAILERILETVDVVVGHIHDFPVEGFPNKASALTEELLSRGSSAVAITKGADGAEMMTTADSPWGEFHSEHPGYEVDTVDTTGAGDAFTAAFIHFLRDDDTPTSEVLSIANASGAITTTKTGAIAAIPDKETITAWLQTRDSEI
jgi:fructokinase